MILGYDTNIFDSLLIIIFFFFVKLMEVVDSITVTKRDTKVNVQKLRLVQITSN